MGRAVVAELLRADAGYALVLFARPQDNKHPVIQQYQNHPDVTVCWGDLINPTDVQKALTGADLVVHMAALISPMADSDPDLCIRINVDGTRNVVDAITALGQATHTRMIFVGSVGQYGNRAAPIHWGRVGDPLLPSNFDNYSVSKI